MRLLHVQDLSVQYQQKTPHRYAILSHRWMATETNLKDIESGGVDPSSFNKVASFAKYVRDHIPGVDHIWVDSCCINQDSAAELSEGVNCMFDWYRNATVCIAYLHDVEHPSDMVALRNSVWFTRGWTLQELLASMIVVFLTKDWQIIGHKGDAAHIKTEVGENIEMILAERTKIPLAVLRNFSVSYSLSVEDRLRWMDGRETLKEEDKFYALFGIFGVTPGANYGEKARGAERRLMNAIASIQKNAADVEAWLSPPDPSTNHVSLRERHEAGTCEWLLHHEQYIRWKADTIQHLWLHGKPGCGKSVLCSTVIEDLRGYCRIHSNVGLVYFYFTFSDARKRGYDELILGLIAQLQRREPARSMLRQLHERSRERRPDTRELEEILVATVATLDKVFIILDALDESHVRPDSRRSPMKQLCQLLSASSKFRLLATSRSHSEILDFIEDLQCAQIPIQPRSVSSDIQQYVATQLSTDPRFRRFIPKVKAVIEESVSNNADGMFRWAFLLLEQLASLKRSGPSSVERALKAFPRDLDDIYARILQDIDEDDKNDALTLLRWITYAREPLSLGQLIDTLIMPPEATALDVESRGQPEDILRLLASLVVTIADKATDEESNGEVLIGKSTRVQLAHFTVQEYLESARILEGDSRAFYIESQAGHLFLGRSCLTYILHYSTSKDKESNKNDLATFPLLEYAAKSWYEHALLHQSDEVSYESKLLQTDTTMSDWLAVHQPDRDWQDPFGTERPRGLGSKLYYASYIGHTKVVKLMVDEGADVNAQGGEHGNALQAASFRGHLGVVEVLVAAGADVDARGGVHDESAVQVASKKGYLEIVKLLLNAGADANTQGGEYGNAFQAAIARGHSEVAKLLLHSGAWNDAPESNFADVLGYSIIGDSGYDTGSHRPTDAGDQDSDAESVRTDGTSHDISDDYTEQLLEQLIEEAVKEIVPQGLGILANMPTENTLRTWFRGCAILVRRDNTAEQVQRKAATFMRHRRRVIALELRNALEESRLQAEDESGRPEFTAQTQQSVHEWLSRVKEDEPYYVRSRSPDEVARSPSPSVPHEHSTEVMSAQDPKSQDEVERYKSLFKHPGFLWLTKQIRSALISQPDIRSRRLVQDMVTGLLDRVPPDEPIKLVLHWNPKNFLAEQYASYDQPQLAKALVYCGEPICGYVTTVDEYACRYWPEVARFVIDCLQQACVDGNYSSSISGVTLRVQLVALSTELEVMGLRNAYAVDVLDLCIWMALSCRAGPVLNCSSYAEPRLPSRQLDSGAPVEVDITFTPVDVGDDTGCCWLRMVGNPVITRGYPIPMRPDHAKGLEMSFPIMVALSQANWATFFHEVFVLKGPFSALVPVTAMQDSVQWHFLRTATSDGDRLTYNEAYAKANAEITRDEMANLDTRRHFVGIWLPDAVHAAGSDREGLYPLMRSTSSLASCSGTEFTLSNITVNAGKFVMVGGTIQIGKKDKHVALKSTLEHPFAFQMIHAAKSSILLYGTDDKRGWLLDGASTVLHLTRAWMHEIWSQLELAEPPTLKQVHRSTQTKTAIATLRENEFLDIGIAHATTTENEDKAEGSAHDSAQPQVAAKAKRSKPSSWTVGTQALHTWQQIESLIDHLRECQNKGLIFSSRRFDISTPSLIGWDATEIGTPATSIDTQIVAVDSAGRHWSNFTRSSNIPTLFAHTFGDLIVPRATTQSPMCQRARPMPQHQTLLAIPLAFLCEVSSKSGEAVSTTSQCVKISDKYYWHDFVAYDLDRCHSQECQCVTMSTISTKGVKKQSLQSESNNDIISLYPNAVALINTCQRRLAKDERGTSHVASKKRKMFQGLSMRFAGSGDRQSSTSTGAMNHEQATSVDVESEGGLELDSRSADGLSDETRSLSRETEGDMHEDEMEVVESRSRSDAEVNNSQTVSTSVVPSVQQRRIEPDRLSSEVSPHEMDSSNDESDNDMHPGYGSRSLLWLNRRRNL